MSDARTCPVCGKAFTARPEFEFCSRECRRWARRKDAYEAAYHAALSRAELEQGRVWGEGDERRALCPYCDHPKRDKEHAALVFNVTTGKWKCHRCEQSGKLREFWIPPDEWTPDGATTQSASSKKGRRTQVARRPVRTSPPPAAREPTPAELAEEADARARLRRLWTTAVPLSDPSSAAGLAYLEGRGITSRVATDARVRFVADYYGRPSVLFPVQDEHGRLVAAEGRYIDGRKNPKGRTAGPKSRGVFEAMPGALDADGVTVCEGPITALSVAACGYPALALCGKSSPPWLLRRLALRSVLIAFDEGEQGTEEKAAALAREFAILGAKPYRLRLPAGVDVNDYLQAAGLDAARAALGDAICAALASPRA